ncbi:MAG: hypothetical protein WAK82_41465 [Streptosporangiaceae bacterium]
MWFEPGLVLKILSAELTLSPNYTAAWVTDQARRQPGHALPPVHRAMSRRQGPDDATTTQELADLYRTARLAPAGS